MPRSNRDPACATNDHAGADSYSRKERQDERLNGDATAVLTAERALANAHRTRDLSRIDTRLHPDYRILQPSGGVETEAAIIPAYAEEDRRWDLAEVTDLTVQTCGVVAQVVGLWRAIGSNRGQAFD